MSDSKWRSEIRASLQPLSQPAPPTNIYEQLRADISAEFDRLNKERQTHWYEGLDPDAIDDLRHLDTRRQLLVEIGLLLDKFEAKEKRI